VASAADSEEDSAIVAAVASVEASVAMIEEATEAAVEALDTKAAEALGAQEEADMEAMPTAMPRLLTHRLVQVVGFPAVQSVPAVQVGMVAEASVAHPRTDPAAARLQALRRMVVGMPTRDATAHMTTDQLIAAEGVADLMAVTEVTGVTAVLVASQAAIVSR
jgi:hypothetical protein